MDWSGDESWVDALMLINNDAIAAAVDCDAVEETGGFNTATGDASTSAPGLLNGTFNYNEGEFKRTQQQQQPPQQQLPPQQQPQQQQQQQQQQQHLQQQSAVSVKDPLRAPLSTAGDVLPLYRGRTVVYGELARMRQLQLGAHVDLSALTQTQMGLVKITKAHHITTNQTLKSGPPSFRVRICKRCCLEPTHIELGTYVNQEGALLANDAHELLAQRRSKLVLLRPEDAPYLHVLRVLRYHRGKPETCSLLEVLAEKKSENEAKRRQQLKRSRDDSSSSDAGGFSVSPGGNANEAACRAAAATQAPFASDFPSRSGGNDTNDLKLVRPVRYQRVLHEAVLEKTFSRLLSDRGVRALFGALGISGSREGLRESCYRVLHRAIDGCSASKTNEGRACSAGKDASDDTSQDASLLSLDEAPIAASLLALLSAFAPDDAGEVGALVARIESTHMADAADAVEESIFDDLMEMEGWGERSDWASRQDHACVPVLQRVKRYLTRAQCFAWRSLYVLKLPAWSRPSDDASAPSILVETQSLLADIQRKYTTALRVLECLSRLPPQLSNLMQEELASAGVVPFQLLAAARGVSVCLGCSVAGLCLRLFDLTGNSEHLELGLHEVNKVAAWTSEHVPEERLVFLIHQVSLRTASARRRIIVNGHSAHRMLERARPHLFTLLDAADSMGLLPNSAGRGQQGEFSLVPEQEDLLTLEHKILVYSAALEFAVLLGQPVAWRPNMRAADAMEDCRRTIEQLRRCHEKEPATLLLPDSNRALAVIMETCHHAATHHPLCRSFAKSLSRSAHALLQENGRRFFYASLLANSTQSLVEFFNQLDTPGPCLPGPCFDAA